MSDDDFLCRGGGGTYSVPIYQWDGSGQIMTKHLVIQGPLATPSRVIVFADIVGTVLIASVTGHDVPRLWANATIPTDSRLLKHAFQNPTKFRLGSMTLCPLGTNQPELISNGLAKAFKTCSHQGAPTHDVIASFIKTQRATHAHIGWRIVQAPWQVQGWNILNADQWAHVAKLSKQYGRGRHDSDAWSSDVPHSPETEFLLNDYSAWGPSDNVDIETSIVLDPDEPPDYYGTFQA
jgi:hypothetical protein